MLAAALGARRPAPTRKPLDEREIVRRIHERIRAHPSAGKMQAYKVTIPNTTVSYGMVPIPAGEFTMGSSGKKDEQPAHKVHVDAFWMQTHEVTWDEYRLFMFAKQAGEIAHKDDSVDAVSRPTRPYVEMSFGMGINGFPAISMTQHAANKYAEWLSAKTGEFYRLPTEAEWEYACRAGAPATLLRSATTPGTPPTATANISRSPRKSRTPGGLYDMLGNVMEWTLDQYAPYKPGDAVNPWVKATALYPHAVRGGSWNDPVGPIIGPILGRLSVPARIEFTVRFMPKMVVIMPTLVAVTLGAGFQLARHVGNLDANYPHHGWLVASYIIVGVMAVIALGLLEPANLAVLFELKKPRPSPERIGRLMRIFVYTAGITGVMQIATIVIMTFLASR